MFKTVIAGYSRSPFTIAKKGALINVKPDELLSEVIKNLISKTKINKNDWKDFNDNYRSFENIITVKQVTADGFRAVFFGKGIGSTLNIGQKIKTTDGSIIQYISIAHNGFMTIFMKSGLFGLLLLLAFLYLLYTQKRDKNPLINQLNMLLMGTSVFLVLSTWVFMGVYFKLDNKSIIIGFILAMREYLIKINSGHLIK